MGNIHLYPRVVQSLLLKKKTCRQSKFTLRIVGGSKFRRKYELSNEKHKLFPFYYLVMFTVKGDPLRGVESRKMCTVYTPSQPAVQDTLYTPSPVSSMTGFGAAPCVGCKG